MIESIVSGAIAGVVAAISFGVLSLAFQRIVHIRKAVVELNHDELFSADGIKLRLLHCWNDDGKCVNRIYRPKLTNKKIWYANVYRPKHLGFQYKWFVEFTEPWTEDQVIQILLKNPYFDIDTSAGKSNRIWIEDKTKANTPDPRDEESINNQYFPE